jgi:hypothetical protein
MTPIGPYASQSPIPEADFPDIEAWQTPLFQSGWLDYDAGATFNPARYRKDAYGRVHLKGLVKSGTNFTIFILPVGYRPQARVAFFVSGWQAGHVIGRIDVLTTGEVYWVAGGTVYMSLDGITFKAG